jgi:GTP cyclohydrolase III
MILNPAQAEAVYSAMCALNNVGALINTTRRYSNREGFKVTQSEDYFGEIVVATFDANDQTTSSESYADQNEFATAHRLN